MHIHVKLAFDEIFFIMWCPITRVARKCIIKVTNLTVSPSSMSGQMTKEKLHDMYFLLGHFHLCVHKMKSLRERSYKNDPTFAIFTVIIDCGDQFRP